MGILGGPGSPDGEADKALYGCLFYFVVALILWVCLNTGVFTWCKEFIFGG